MQKTSVVILVQAIALTVVMALSASRPQTSYTATAKARCRGLM